MYNLDCLKEIIKNKDINYNEFYLKKYFNFCSSLIEKYNNKKIDKQDSEKHHILPVSLFPELSKEKSNIINISLREHYLAHWLLAKTFGGKMWFAFNQMKRTIKNSRKNSILYEYSKKYIKNLISINNKGLKRSLKFKETLSKRMKNKLLARDLNGNIMLVDKNDERLKNGQLVYFRKGSNLTEKTKIKISENGLKGRKSYVNIKTGEVKFFKKEDEIPKYFKKAPNPKLKKMKTCKNTVWIYDKILNKQFRIKKENLSKYQDNNRFILKRIKTKGFSLINTSEKKKYVDLLNKKYVFISENNKTKYMIRYDGKKIDNIIVYILENKIFLGKTNLILYISNDYNIKKLFNKDKLTYYFFNKNEKEILKKLNILRKNILELERNEVEKIN